MMALLLVALILLLCYIGKIYYRHVYLFNKYLKKFPCPPEVPILGHALDFASDEGTLNVLMRYINDYGETVRIKTGPQRQLLLTSDQKFFQFVLTNMRILKKSVDYQYFKGWLGNGLITSDGARWKKHRQIITPTFHYQVLEDFVDIFEKNAKILSEKFEKTVPNTSVEIYDLVNLCTLDIICESTMGTSVKAQENTESEYVQSVKIMLDIIIERAFTPHKMIDCIYYFTEDYRKEQQALQVIRSYSGNVIRRRQEAFRAEKENNVTANRKKAFLDILLEANLNGEQLTLDEIREEVDTFMFAGHDTTGTSLCFTLFCLANHPEEQDKVFSEQKGIFSDDFHRLASLQDLKNMKYLELVIKESLRLYPPAPFYSRELDQDMVYEGTILPKGLTLSLFTFALHRNANYFSDPEEFRPRRFENFNGKMPFAFLPFSAGPRNCIGQKFAMAEIKTVVSRIIRHFELLPAIPSHELKLASQTILISSNGVRIRFRKRI